MKHLPTEYVMKILPKVCLMVICFSLAATSFAADVQVLTQHNDPQRTGANVAEQILTPANVHSSGFERLGSYTVSGQVFAQPLFTSINGDHRLYIATARNLVYAFDADRPNSGPIWVYDAGSNST